MYTSFFFWGQARMWILIGNYVFPIFLVILQSLGLDMIVPEHTLTHISIVCASVFILSLVFAEEKHHEFNSDQCFFFFLENEKYIHGRITYVVNFLDYMHWQHAYMFLTTKIDRTTGSSILFGSLQYKTRTRICNMCTLIGDNSFPIFFSGNS